MLIDLFKPYTCSIAKQVNANFIAYQITGPLPGLNQFIFWDISDNLEKILKPQISRFISVLSNGAILENIMYNATRLNEFIDQHYVNLSPDLKLDCILNYINQLTEYDGQSVALPTIPLVQLAKMYFTNEKEWQFYKSNALSEGFIDKTARMNINGTQRTEYFLTISGLTRLIRINEGKVSNQCFVAMAFTDDMFNIAEKAIKPALTLCGFRYHSVSEQHIDSDKTINDAILVGIKKSRFTIADFTHHRGGVYFEAGYALGRNQKVIYTCRYDHMDKAHFDIRNYQHIVWNDHLDFKQKLIDKIEAFIKE